VNYYNRDLPLTKEFLKLHNTVPAGYDAQGNPLRESMPIVYWVESQWPKKNPLLPAGGGAKGGAEGLARVKAVIDKYTTSSSPFDITMPFYQCLGELDPKKSQSHAAKLLNAYAELARDLTASGGPYLLGQQFTVADIALIPFVQRALLLLPHYRNFAVPESDSYAAFRRWVAAFESRPSVRISNADRLPRSVAVQPFGARKRSEYLVEMYASYAFGVKDQVRSQLAHAPPGVATADIAAALRQREEQETLARALVRQNRSFRIAAVVAVGAIVAAKLYFWNRARK
jgi:glutathione S-transferase